MPEMITATELLDFLCKAKKLSAGGAPTFHKTDGGYYITLYCDWHDDANCSRQIVFIDNEGESTWDNGNYEFWAMNNILDEMIEKQKEKEIKEQKRKELIARLTEEEKELLNLN